MALEDIFFIPVALIVTVVAIMFIGLVWFSIDDELNEGLNNTESANATGNVSQSFNLWDYSFITIAIGLPLMAAILASFVPTHPAILIFAIVAVGIFMLLFPQLANLYVDLATEPDIDAAGSIDPQTRWPLTTFIMQRYPLYAAISGAIILVALFAKPGGRELE